MKKLFALLAAAFAVNIAVAQPPMGPPPGMIRKSPTERIAGLTEELKLTAEQAEKFAPVYLNYQGEVRKIRQDLKKLMESYEGVEMTEKVAFRMVMEQLNADADIIACKKEYMRVFKDYLTSEQLSKIFLVEKFANRPRGHKGGPGAPDGQGMPPMGPPPGVPMP